jgi:hypothetical protein
LPTPLRLPTKKVSAESSSPGAALSTWRSRKQGLSFSRNAACSAVISIAFSALACSSASQRSTRVPSPVSFRIFWMVIDGDTAALQGRCLRGQTTVPDVAHSTRPSPRRSVCTPTPATRTAPWQRGSIENANGRLRRDLPRTTRLGDYSDADIDDVICNFNAAPRKCLGYLTPIEAFPANLGVALEL